MQSGQVYRLGQSWAYRYRAPDGKRPQRGGFRTKGEARAALTEVLGRLSRGETSRADPPTLQELVAEYLEQHVAEDSTIETLRYRLQHASLRPDSRRQTEAGGDRRLEETASVGLGPLRPSRAPPGTSVRRPLPLPGRKPRGAGSQPRSEARRDEDLFLGGARYRRG